LKLSCILTLQSGHNNHHLYKYNINIEKSLNPSSDLSSNTSYIYDNLICEIKNTIISCILVSEPTRQSLPICISTSKLTKFEPQSDPNLNRRNPSLVRNTPYIYGYFICASKIKILSWIPKFQSGHNNHLFYL
jgi:hypothetical protein